MESWSGCSASMTSSRQVSISQFLPRDRELNIIVVEGAVFYKVQQKYLTAEGFTRARDLGKSGQNCPVSKRPNAEHIQLQKRQNANLSQDGEAKEIMCRNVWRSRNISAPLRISVQCPSTLSSITTLQ